MGGRKQHRVGRKVTRKILESAMQVRSEAIAKQNCINAMQEFITMYRPHAPREDVVLFPKLRYVVFGDDFDAISEEMEKRQRRSDLSRWDTSTRPGRFRACPRRVSHREAGIARGSAQGRVARRNGGKSKSSDRRKLRHRANA